jgi:hypothetical protein
MFNLFARKNIAAALLAISVATLTGCMSEQDLGKPENLDTQLGKQITLTGEFTGPGKPADYVQVGETPIYLTGKPDLGVTPISYHTKVTVIGTLQHSLGVATLHDDEQSQPPYYYIDNAQVQKQFLP